MSRFVIAAALVGLGLAGGFAAGRIVRHPERLKKGLRPTQKESDEAAGLRWVKAPTSGTSGAANELDALGYVQGYNAAAGRTGIVVDDEARACTGLNLYVSGHAPVATLIGMDGKVLHEWTLPLEEICPDACDPEVEATRFYRRASLLPDGSLLVVIDYRALFKLGRDSKLIWKCCEPYHHDVEVDATGRVFGLARVKSQLRAPAAGTPFLDDEIRVLSPAGEVLERVSVLDAFADSEWGAVAMRVGDGAELGRTGDVFHTNSIRYLDGSGADQSPPFAAGNVLISVRRLDTLAIVDLKEKKVVWAGIGPWHAQHDASPLENGHILLFDNGGNSFVDTGKMSRVLEFDPVAHRVAWSYDGAPDQRYGSPRCGAAQRLPNGNTLITITAEGRAIEVTPKGEVVWEFRNPHRAGDEGELIAGLFQMSRIFSPDTDWLKTR